MDDKTAEMIRYISDLWKRHQGFPKRRKQQYYKALRILFRRG